jgi:hypothetical protein
MFIEEVADPTKYKSSGTPKTPKNVIHDEFGYSQSPNARIEILKLREKLEECRTKLKQCEKKGKTKKKKKRKTKRR